MNPTTPLLVMNYYDRASGPYKEYLGPAIGALDSVIASEAARFGAILVDDRSYFAGRTSELYASGDIHPNQAGHLALANLFSNAMPPDSDGDGLSDVMEAVLGTNPAAPDSDGDGCSDGREFGPNPVLGGRRDPTNVWDYFDTPTTFGHRDGKIKINDVLAIVKRFRSSGDRNIDPLSTPPLPPAYHTAFDRAGAGSNSGPDGRITTDDIVHVIDQYSNDCV